MGGTVREEARIWQPAGQAGGRSGRGAENAQPGGGCLVGTQGGEGLRTDILEVNPERTPVLPYHVLHFCSANSSS